MTIPLFPELIILKKKYNSLGTTNISVAVNYNRLFSQDVDMSVFMLIYAVPK